MHRPCQNSIGVSVVNTATIVLHLVFPKPPVMGDGITVHIPLAAAVDLVTGPLARLGVFALDALEA